MEYDGNGNLEVNPALPHQAVPRQAPPDQALFHQTLPQASPASAMARLDERRLGVTRALDRKHRSAFGQFLTPSAVAQYMASLLEFPEYAGEICSAFPRYHGEARLLDPGAGIGSLTAAAAWRAAGRNLHATCYELERSFQSDLRATLACLPNVTAKIECCDFIEHAASLAAAGVSPGYSHAILNPPYKKIGTHSRHRMLMRQLGVETSNLYTCFLACAICLCRPGAQVVAIVPRSFMNGLYFKPFRYWLLDRVAITHIHVFDSRDRAFSDDEVLQENVILRMIVAGRQTQVEVTASNDQRFSDMRHRLCDFAEIVTPGDAEKFLHVPTLGSPCSDGLPGKTLREIGLDVCTGPVVDFRLREHITQDAEPGAVPLLYPSHFAGGRFEWPRQGRKPNSIRRNSETEQWLMPNGCYVILRRFSSKEEKRRVVAYLFDGSALPSEMIGFENHLNVIHQNRRGLTATVARGLVAYLNSQEVDDYFRVFSGHTQVNATDLRRLRYPTIEQLAGMS
jgi:adenine-specific DNA-methyltransferase